MTSLVDISRTILAAAVIFSILFFMVNAQYPKKEKFQPISEDVRYIRCETCQKAVKHLYRKTKELREKAPGKKVSEEEIINKVEKTCDPGKEEGEWIAKIDLVANNDELRLIEKQQHGRCRRECQTIAKACEGSIGEQDTDLGELLWQDKLTLSKLINKFCFSMSSSCKKNNPKLKGPRKIDEEFIVMSEDERKADQMLKQMRGIPGMPGMEMYSRDDMEKMREQMGDQLPKKSAEAEKELPIDEEGLLYEGGGVSFLQIIKDGYSRLTSWMKNLYKSAFSKSEL